MILRPGMPGYGTYLRMYEGTVCTSSTSAACMGQEVDPPRSNRAHVAPRVIEREGAVKSHEAEMTW